MDFMDLYDSLKQEYVDVHIKTIDLKKQLQQCKEENEGFIEFLKKELVEVITEKQRLKKELQECKEENIKLQDIINKQSSEANNK